jgi:hypothetical protein
MKRYVRYFGIDDQFIITEATINPVLYLNQINKDLKDLSYFKFKNSSLKNIAIKLNIIFRKSKIQFIPQSFILEDPYEQGIEFGINSAATLSNKNNTIGFFINHNIIKSLQDKEQYNIFVKWFLFNLKHELVHRGQHLKVKDTKIVNQIFKKSYKDQIDYLSDKQEIMARAWEIIELFKLSNYTNENIRKIIQSKNLEKFQNFTLKTYHSIFNMNDWQMKLLYKYMYLYLEEINNEIIK